MRDLVIVKFGGSSITHKEKPFSTNYEILSQAMQELASSKHQVILVHGGGSYGHPVAKKYLMKTGSQEFAQEIQRNAIAETRFRMEQLHLDVLAKAQEFLLPLFSLPASALVHELDTGYRFTTSSLQETLNRGLFPVLYGDVIFSERTGHTILSGDTIISLLIDEFGNRIRDVIFGSDVDGLFTEDPKENPNAKLLTKVSLSDIQQLLEGAKGSQHDDVTGGMYGKLLEIRNIVSQGSSVKIINLTTPGRLTEALQSDHFVGSYFSSSEL